MSRISRRDVIPNQVFVGCPWKTVRRKYEAVIQSLSKKYPLSFVIVGRDSSQEAEDLLEIIKTKLTSSSYAVFDATGGNPNVSLEFGFADATDIPRALYISSRKAAASSTDQSPIISDLAGKRRNAYKTEKSLNRLLSLFSKNHNYTKQFEKCLHLNFRKLSKGEKKRNRALALKLVHCLDGVDKLRRADAVQTLLTLGQGYSEVEIDRVITMLNKSRLLICEPGRYSRLRMI